jgi:predicted N-acetyltransferase YhbS
MGFLPGSPLQILWERTGNEEAFMVQELAQGGLAGLAGVVRYRPEFGTV